MLKIDLPRDPAISRYLPEGLSQHIAETAVHASLVSAALLTCSQWLSYGVSLGARQRRDGWRKWMYTMEHFSVIKNSYVEKCRDNQIKQIKSVSEGQVLYIFSRLWILDIDP